MKNTLNFLGLILGTILIISFLVYINIRYQVYIRKQAIKEALEETNIK